MELSVRVTVEPPLQMDPIYRSVTEQRWGNM